MVRFPKARARRSILLDVHSAQHHQVGPLEVAFLKVFDGAIDKPQLPALGAERRHCEQAQRRMDGFLGQNLHHLCKAPKRRRKTRPDQKDLDVRPEGTNFVGRASLVLRRAGFVLGACVKHGRFP
jgi:hypothetical protein